MSRSGIGAPLLALLKPVFFLTGFPMEASQGKFAIGAKGDGRRTEAAHNNALKLRLTCTQVVERIPSGDGGVQNCSASALDDGVYVVDRSVFKSVYVPTKHNFHAGCLDTRVQKRTRRQLPRSVA